MAVTRIVMIDHRGREWRLVHPKRDVVFLVEGGIDGLMGALTETPAAAVGVPGQIVAPEDAQIPALMGSLTVMVDPEGAGSGEVVDELVSEWRAAWSPWHKNSMVVETGLGKIRFGIRLNGGIPAPVALPDEDDKVQVSVPVVVDRGLGEVDMSSPGPVVTVTNSGDVWVSPRIMWKGAGGVVTLPSGATFTLPPVSESRVLVLDAQESLAVVDAHGVLDRPLWEELRGVAMPEGIPRGERRTYEIPNGAALVWSLGYLDWWR